MMNQHKLHAITAVAGRVVIEADGDNHSVAADIDGIEGVTLQGDLAGSLVVLGR